MEITMSWPSVNGGPRTVGEDIKNYLTT